MLSGPQNPDEAKEALYMKAAGECRARERKPSPPRLSCMCLLPTRIGDIYCNEGGEAQPYLFIAELRIVGTMAWRSGSG